MSSPIICFGQQPCGFFPRRFLAAKFFTARRLQAELGGEIVFSTTTAIMTRARRKPRCAMARPTRRKR